MYFDLSTAKMMSDQQLFALEPKATDAGCAELVRFATSVLSPLDEKSLYVSSGWQFIDKRMIILND